MLSIRIQLELELVIVPFEGSKQSRQRRHLDV
jgi:hypothetical protein